MSRSVMLLFSAILATTTGIALAGAGLLLIRPEDGIPTSTSAAPVVAFVAAVNRALRTGDTTMLDSVVTADYVDHGPASVFGADRAGLARYLSALRATYPDLQLALDDAVVSGSRVAVRLSAHGHQSQTFLGTPLPQRPAGWTTMELFRVEHGAVAEHWGSAPGVDLYQSLLTLPEELPIAGVVTTTVARLRSLGSESFPVTLPGDAIVLVEDGQIVARSETKWHVTHPGAATTAIEPGIAVFLSPGDVAYLPGGSSTVQSTDRHSSFVLAVTIQANAFVESERRQQYPAESEPGEVPSVAELLRSGSQGTVTAEGLIVERLARIRPPATMGAAVSLEFGRVMLSPGGSLRLRSSAASRGIAVETGAIELDPMDGRLEIQQSPREGQPAPPLRIDEAVALGVGDAVIVPNDHEAVFRNTGDTPAVILIAVLEPTDAAPPPPTSSEISSSVPTTTPDDGPASEHPS